MAFAKPYVSVKADRFITSAVLDARVVAYARSDRLGRIYVTLTVMGGRNTARALP